MSDERLDAARSFLFVPGNRPERFSKAVASGADAVILDLEDAVRPAEKPSALEHVAAWLATQQGPPCIIVRVNGVGTPWHADDLAALRGLAPVVMVPKAENPDELNEVHEVLGGTPLIGLVETPRGVSVAEQVAATDGVERLALGNVDLAAALGVAPDSHQALAAVRSALALASAIAGLAQPVDGVTTSVHSAAALERDLEHAHDMGFGGKLCIHPAQVPAVMASFSPAAADVQWATDIMASAGDDVTMINGEMVDRPVLLRAQAILARARLEPGQSS